MTYAATRALARKAGRLRYTIGGIDVTYFRDYATPEPRYTLMEPFAYGSTSIQFPQIHAGYESPGFGSGELAWVKTGKRVVFSRVFEDGSETIDYVGIVDSVECAGRILNLELGGEFAGPASMREEDNQLFREVIDVGRWASLAAAAVGLSFSPWFGPVTGIKLAHAGGQSSLSWAQYVGTMSQDTAGVQRALMPTVWGGSTWGFAQKDYTTKHLTIFNDDARAVVSVVDDATEQPNVIKGTGITPDGERITNAKFPNVFAGPAPDYPISGGASFGLGTTEADTVNGDGITVLYDKLRNMSYLPFAIENTGVYTSDFVAAVKRLQRVAGLSATGTMTTAAWDALYDNGVTGYRINGAYIAPLAEADEVREWNRSSNGAILGRNPSYDPTVLRVERTIDFGEGITKAAMIAYAQGVLARSGLKNWTGTIRLAGNGAFTGAHDTNAGLTTADLMPYRDIRPGMNAWLPYFDGGTLVHVSGVDVDPDGATLTVDTQARDLMELREILDRNRDSRRDIRREWNAANRSRKPSTAMVACDESFGWIDRNVALEGNKWNRVPVIAGQHGQVNRVRIKLFNDEAEFAVAVTAKHYGAKWFNHNVGDPLASRTTSVWEKASLSDEFDNRFILYAAGDGTDPCGYGTGHKYVNGTTTRTDRDLTGLHVDDSPWPYINAAGTAVLLYVWIYPDRDCVLRKGRILYPQLDDAAA